MINGSFVFGFDHDDEGVFDRTVAWAQEQHLDTATFHILTPYPGTPLFRQLDQEGRILTRDWGQYDTAHVVFQPKRMGVWALQTGYERAYDRFYASTAMLRRVLCDSWGWLPRLFLNVGYKRMNPFWPVLAKLRLADLPFKIFIIAAAAHRAGWRTAPAERPAMAEGRG
jgi:radical SAM superfamily enzyme YgiQ (UPF0313 family)